MNDLREQRIPITERWASSPLSFEADPDAHPMTDAELQELNRARRDMGLSEITADQEP